MPAWVKNESQFLDRIRRRAKLLAFQHKPMRRVLAYEEESIVRGTLLKQRRIKSAGSRKFPPLSPAYKRWKDRIAPNAPILSLTGAMLAAQSFKQFISSVAGITTGKLTYEGPFYGVIHQKPGRSKVKQRAWFGFRTGDDLAIRRIIAAGIGRMMRSLRYE